MNFAKRFKSDKGFRFKVILIFIVIVLIYGNMGNKDVKKMIDQPTCNTANRQTGTFCDFDSKNVLAYNKIGSDSCMYHALTDSDENLCVGLQCTIGRGDEDYTTDTWGCFDCAPAGIFVRASGNCCGPRVSMDGPSDFDFLCQQEAPEDECSTSLQTQIASIVKAIPGLGNLACKTRFYIIAFGGGLVAMIFIFAAL